MAGKNKALETRDKISPAKAIAELPEPQSQLKTVFRSQVTAGNTTIEIDRPSNDSGSNTPVWRLPQIAMPNRSISR